MERLNEFAQILGEAFQSLVGDSSTVLLVLIFAAVFLAVMAVVAMFSGGRSTVERRLAGDVAVRSGGEAGPSLRQQEREGPWTRLMASVEKHFSPSDETRKTSVQRKMVQAGYMSPTAVRTYYVIRVVCMVTFPLLFLLFASVYPHKMTVQDILFGCLCAGFIGLVLPPAWVSRKTTLRQLAVTESFPDALDMMVVCVEAGLGLDAAFTRVGTQISRSHPVLASHFGLVALELRAGKSREDALRNLAARVGIQEISSFSTLLIQSDNLGTSVAQTLRVHADEMRAKRMLRAEEKAQMLPVKLSIPLVTCILPTILTVVLLPGIIRIAHTLIPLLTGR